MVLAGIECSQKSLIFANGIPVQESVDFFDTLKGIGCPIPLFLHLYIKQMCYTGYALTLKGGGGGHKRTGGEKQYIFKISVLKAVHYKRT